MNKKQRYKRKLEKEKAELANRCVSLFYCKSCHLRIKLAWRNLGERTPTCKVCGYQLVMFDACVQKGIVPEVSTRRKP